MDLNSNLKLADFGFSAPLSGRDGSGQLKTPLGTRSYMAPEIHNKQGYDGALVDVFAAGIILFITYAGHPPFRQALPNDEHYSMIATGKIS